MSEYNLGLAPTALYSNDSALERGSTAHMARNHRNDQTDRKGLSVSEMGLGLPSPVLLARGLYKTGTLKVSDLLFTRSYVHKVSPSLSSFDDQVFSFSPQSIWLCSSDFLIITCNVFRFSARVLGRHWMWHSIRHQEERNSGDYMRTRQVDFTSIWIIQLQSIFDNIFEESGHCI